MGAHSELTSYKTCTNSTETRAIYHSLFNGCNIYVSAIFFIIVCFGSILLGAVVHYLCQQSGLYIELTMYIHNKKSKVDIVELLSTSMVSHLYNLTHQLVFMYVNYELPISTRLYKCLIRHSMLPIHLNNYDVLSLLNMDEQSIEYILYYVVIHYIYQHNIAL